MSNLEKQYSPELLKSLKPRVEAVAKVLSTVPEHILDGILTSDVSPIEVCVALVNIGVKATGKDISEVWEVFFEGSYSDFQNGILKEVCKSIEKD